MGIGSLRQGAQKYSQNSSSGGKGGKGGFFNKLRIPKRTPKLEGLLRPNEPIGEPIMLIKPDQLYDDVYDVDEQGRWKGTKGEALHIVIHQVQTMKDGKARYNDFPCTAGPNAHAPQPCIGCQQNDAGNKSVGNGRQQWAFNVKHLVPYHEVPLTDKKNGGAIVMKKDKPNEPVMVLQACQVGTPSEKLYHAQGGQWKPCEYCQRNIPITYGAPKAYVLGKNHLDELLKVDTHLEQTCANCMTRLIKTAYTCRQCGNDLLDLSRTQLINEQLEQYSKTPQQCQCGFTGLPQPAYDCGYDPNGMYKVPNGCPQDVTPRPLSIFDCVFYVHKEGEDTQSKLVVSPPVPIQHFRTITGQTDLPQWLKSPHLARTFNLPEMFKPLSLEDQAKACGVANSYAPQQPQYQQYPNQPQAPQQQGFAPGQYGMPQPQQPGYPQAPQYGAPQPQMPQQQPPPQYGMPVPGYPPQQPQWPQQQPAQPYPQQGQPQGPPGMPFSGRPDYGK